MALTTCGEKKTLKTPGHAQAVARSSFGSRTLVLQPLMTYIICRWLGEDVFTRPAAMKTPLCGWALNNCIVPGLLINMRGGWRTIPAVLSGANRGRTRGPWAQQGPHQWVPRMAGCDSDSWTDVGYVSVYLCVCVCVLVLTAGMEGIVLLCLPYDWKSLFHCT